MKLLFPLLHLVHSICFPNFLVLEFVHRHANGVKLVEPGVFDVHGDAELFLGEWLLVFGSLPSQTDLLVGGRPIDCWPFRCRRVLRLMLNLFLSESGTRDIWLPHWGSHAHQVAARRSFLSQHRLLLVLRRKLLQVLQFIVALHFKL